MEKEYKPLPDVECLKYHGTPDNPDIKIFVSHRIDQDSETIDNPLYIPVRCGAVYDKRGGITMLGDDTGDNISEKRETFCELTVQYWAWKNVKADYYGLCHYRRYLSFLNKDFPGPGSRQGIFDTMTKATLEYCGLTDEENIRKKIIEADVTVPYEYSLDDVWAYNLNVKTIKESWLTYHRSYLKDRDFDMMIELVRKIAPEYLRSAQEYIARPKFYGFNCFVMKREYFVKMCEFMFPVLAEFDKNLDKTHYSVNQERAAGYLGEWLFSIFIYHIKKEKKVNVVERQLLAFQNTERYQELPTPRGNSIPIVFVATESNLPMIGVQIQSVIHYANAENKYIFIILNRAYDADMWKTNVLKEERYALQQIIEKHQNMSIQFYHPASDLGSLAVREWGKNKVEEEYYLICLPWILTKFERVIFLQDGILVQRDIADLFYENIDGACLAAVKNICFSACLNGYLKDFKELCKKKLKMNDCYNYISTDVILFDLKKARSLLNKNQIFSMLDREYRSDVATNFNDKFNEIYDGKIKFLPQRWNMLECWGPDYFSMCEYFPKEDDLQRKGEPAYILNMKGPNGAYLPIQSKVMRLFWKYAKETPFYEDWVFASTNYQPQISDLMNRIGVFDTRSGARKFADRVLPPGTKRREFTKKLLPKGSLRWKLCKQIYYLIKPQYRPKKNGSIGETI